MRGIFGECGAILLPIFEVQPDCILDLAQSLIVGVSMTVTTLKSRAGDIEALRIAFDDDRQRVVLHVGIVLREARPATAERLDGIRDSETPEIVFTHPSNVPSAPWRTFVNPEPRKSLSNAAVPDRQQTATRVARLIVRSSRSLARLSYTGKL